jgi:membrane protease YdiL (CAAX protease family)
MYQAILTHVRWVSVFFLILITWTLYRYFVTSPEWVDEFIAKPLLQILPVILTVLFLEKKSLSSLSIGSKTPLFHIGIGLAAGTFLVAESLLMQRMKYGSLNISLEGAILPFFISLATGFSEELVYRGYFARRIADVTPNIIVATILQSIVFVLIHVPIILFVLHYGVSDALLYSMQLGILGFFYGYIFLETGSILPTVMAHTLWNFTNSIVR